ncbi:ketopantoate reductase family protein [Saccharicrinis sp. FJH62]|uniref:ketopantoate reductase family protein n=1 Tax=Saccharicrinis sp. FJH62 TaxID=3344657 RepID=UPI0035D40E00
MKICVIGTGGVGGYFGGRMAQAGYDVTFVARGEHLKAIQEKGLDVKSVNGDFLIHPAKATNEPDITFDLVILAVKVWQIEALEPMIKKITTEDSILLPIENGIDAPAILQKWVSPGQVLGGLCRIFSWIDSPGVIRHAAYDPSITFGELDNRVTYRVKEIATIFEKSNIKYHIAEDIELEMWRKFLFITSTSSIGALTRVPFGVFMKLPETRQLLTDVVSEMIDVGLAKGVNVTKGMIPEVLTFSDKMPADATTSLQRDIMDGKPSELEGQIGTVVRLANELNVKTDHCRLVYTALLPQEKVARGEFYMS